MCIRDRIRRKALKTSTLKLLILDEADEMLSSGFKDQIAKIFKKLPEDVKIGLFSATMSDELIEITKMFMRDPIKILVKNEELTLQGIKQYYVQLNTDSDKYETLKDIFSTLTISQSIIYCNSVKSCLLYTSPSPRDLSTSRMPSSA